MRPLGEHAGLSGFAALWRREVAREGFVPMDVGELDALLQKLTGRLAEALQAEEFAPQAAREVGAALADAHLTEPAVLAATVSIIGTHLLDAVAGGADGHPPGDVGGHDGQRRVVDIQAAVATG
jgi:hypothetical protein